MSRKSGKGSKSGSTPAKLRSQESAHYNRGGGGLRSRIVRYSDKVPF